MDGIFAVLNLIQPYHWLALALVLLIAEMASGTTYLLWPAAAAGLVGLLGFLVPLNGGLELALFAALVIALTAFGRPLVRNLRIAAPVLNDRMTQMVGARGVAAGDFANGVGAVKLGDTVWRATSEHPIAAGVEVEVIAIEGATVKVRAATT